MSSQISTSHLKLAELIGNFIEYWGFKAVHGRIWTMIFLSKEPVNAKFLIDKLDISKALVSMSIKDLLHYNVITEVEKDGPSTQKYTFNPDIFTVVTNVLKTRESQLLREINEQISKTKATVKRNNDEDDVCTDQLQALAEMAEAAEVTLSSLLSVGKVNVGAILSVLRL